MGHQSGWCYEGGDVCHREKGGYGSGERRRKRWWRTLGIGGGSGWDCVEGGRARDNGGVRRDAGDLDLNLTLIVV